ncbi:MAG: cyclic peptide export ABC transporter [Cyclobacteriaceae bacterium]
MRIIRLLIKSSFKLFLLATLASILTGFCSTMVIKTIHEAVQGNTEFNIQHFAIRFAGYWIGFGLLSVVASYTVSLLTRIIIHRLRIDFSTKILNSTFESVEHNQSKLLPILTEDVKTVTHNIDRLPAVTTGLATVIGILVYMVYFSPTLSLATLIIFILVFLVTKASLPYVRKYAHISRHYLNDLFIKFEGLVFGIKELTLNQEFRKSYLEDQIIPASDVQNKYFLRENIASSITSRLTDMTLLLGLGTLILLISNLNFVTLNFFGEYLTLVLFTISPLSTASGFMSGLKRIEAALDHIEEVGIDLDEAIQKKEIIENKHWNDTEALIELKQIEHTYYHSEKDESFTLGPIDLPVQRGEMIFMIGGNGSGKTTLAKILLGLYAPRKGQILYRNTPVTKNAITFYRSRFSAIFSDSYVFDQLLHIDETELAKRGKELIEMLELTKKVKIENGKFSTKRLSDGQKKRLALIISILEDKEIYLFDEWAANQDPHFKEIFYTKILSYLKARNKTIIVITHDDRYFTLADRLIKLRNGQVTENSTPEIAHENLKQSH